MTLPEASVLKFPLPSRINGATRAAAVLQAETEARLHRVLRACTAPGVVVSLGEEARDCIGQARRAEMQRRQATIRAAACIQVALERWLVHTGHSVPPAEETRALCQMAFPGAHDDEQVNPLRGADAALRRALALHELAGEPADITRHLAIAAAFAAMAMEELP